MSELSETLRWMLERKSGRLLSTYAASFVLLNWKFFYILLISSESKGGQRISDAWHEFFTGNIFLVFVRDFGILQFVFPALVTWIIIRYVPAWNNWAFKFHLAAKKKREVMRSASDAEIAEAIFVNKKRQANFYIELARKEEVISQVRDELSEETVWLEQYNKLKSVDVANLLIPLKQAMIDRHGNRNYVNGRIAEFALTNDLIDTGAGNNYTLTKKGKFYLSQLN